jgi:hypothetical protein
LRCFSNKNRYPKIPVLKDDKVFPYDIVDYAKNGKTALKTSIAKSTSPPTP